MLRQKNSLQFDNNNVNWLANQWMQLTGMEYPTLLEIVKGIQEEEKIY